MRRLFYKFFKKQTGLSFGLDWGSNYAKLIGLRMLGDKYELTHVWLFELPVFSSSKHLTKMILHKLRKINFYGAKITVGLPSTEVSIQQSKNLPVFERVKNLLSRGKKPKNLITNEETYNLKVSEDFVKSEWHPRKALDGISKRLELDCLVIPFLQKSKEKEKYLFLDIGYSTSQAILSCGGTVIERKSLKFNLQSIIPEHRNQECQNNIFTYLSSKNISFCNGKWICENHESIDGFNDILIRIQENLKMLEEDLKEFFFRLNNEYKTGIFQLKILGGGGLFDWIKQYIAVNMKLPVQNVNPLSQLSTGKANINFKHLYKIESLFSKAIALAMTGAQAKKRKNLDLLRSIPQNCSPNRSIKRARLVGLSISFVLLLIFGFTSMFYTQKIHELVNLREQNQELENHLSAVQLLSDFHNKLSPKQKKSIPRTTFRKVSPILQVISEQMPIGTWITDVKVIPAKLSKRTSKKRQSKQNQMKIVIEGRGVSGNYISELFNKLYQTGYFSQLLLENVETDQNSTNLISYKLVANIRDANGKNSS